MGSGDWIIASGQVKKLHSKRHLPVLVVGPDGRAYWDPVFENNPKILKQPPSPELTHDRLINAPGARPYLAGMTKEHWIFKSFAIETGELFFTEAERAFAEPYRGRIMIEPNIKAIGHSNKAWITDRWQQLVDTGIGPMIQCTPPGTRSLNGVQGLTTTSFRLACAVLAVSRAFVGTEGGLHHAAAAVGTPAVVLFSEFISPQFTGYSMHRNLRHAGEACGRRIPCTGCRESMLRISVDEVAINLSEVLHEQSNRSV